MYKIVQFKHTDFFMFSDYFISTDKTKIDVELVHHYLSNESYWSKNIPLDIVKKSIENSVCFSVFYKETQIGFARVITDKATFGYLADVFILEAHRGKGLSKWLMQTILGHEELQGFRSWMLGTKDAHGMYEKFGFKLTNDTTRIMRKQGIEGY
jgi:GNAT superfamily N-acetyltransferase